MKTYTVKKDSVKKDWYVVDASGKTVGRLATRIAEVLIGKHKPQFSTNADAGDFVVVINADKVQFTGRKWTQKQYRRHSGYPGGLTEVKAVDMHSRYPTRVLELAVKGMLPKNKLRTPRMNKLKIYAGPEHPHAAQQPKPLEYTKG
ncbi:MAG: 50S ribosomal protein L13 [Candidatus Eremiobacterota bacterium]